MTHQPFRELAVKAFRARLESFGIDPLELIEIATLNRNSINHGQEPPSVHEVLETAVTMSGDPAIAIRIGEDIDLAAYGTYGFAVMSSVTWALPWTSFSVMDSRLFCLPVGTAHTMKMD